MKIVCPSCSAAYRFEASKVPDGGKKVQCSRCSHVFTVRRPNDPSGDPNESGQALGGRDGSTDPAGGSGELKRLIVRQDGTRYKVRDLPTLQRWIVERRLTREAEVSFDGDTWEKVGERGDLLPYFDMVDREAQRTFLPSGAGPETTRGVSIKPRIEGVRVMTALRPGDDDDDDDYEYEDDDDYEDDFEELDDDYLDDDDDDEELADFVEEDDTPAGGVFTFPDLGEIDDDDDDDDDVVSWQGAPKAPTPGDGTPIFNKASLVSDDASAEPLELEVEEEAQAPIIPTPVPPPTPPKEEEDRKVPIVPIALVAILLCGLVYFLFLRTPEVPGPIAKVPVTSTPVKAKPTPTATPKPTPTATAKPTPTVTPKPTPTAKPRPRATPKPRRVATPRPRAQAPTTSPAVLADRAYREGKALQNKGDFTGAVEQFKIANRHRPRALHYEELGFTSLEIHDSSQKASALSQAESSFREALKLEKRADSWLGLGVTFRRQGKTEDAIQAFEACLRARPSENTAGEAEWFLKQLKAGNP